MNREESAGHLSESATHRYSLDRFACDWSLLYVRARSEFAKFYSSLLSDSLECILSTFLYCKYGKTSFAISGIASIRLIPVGAGWPYSRLVSSDGMSDILYRITGGIGRSLSFITIKRLLRY